MPLSHLLGGTCGESFDLYICVGIDEPDVMATETKQYKNQGFKKFQLKASGIIWFTISCIYIQFFCVCLPSILFGAPDTDRMQIVASTSTSVLMTFKRPYFQLKKQIRTLSLLLCNYTDSVMTSLFLLLSICCGHNGLSMSWFVAALGQAYRLTVTLCPMCCLWWIIKTLFLYIQVTEMALQRSDATKTRRVYCVASSWRRTHKRQRHFGPSDIICRGHFGLRTRWVRSDTLGLDICSTVKRDIRSILRNFILSGAAMLLWAT